MKLLPSILRCTAYRQLVWLFLAYGGFLSAQQTSPVVLSETVVSKDDGGTVTFQKVAPPATVPVTTPVLSEEQVAKMRERAAQKRMRVTVQARTFAGAGSELRFSAGSATSFRAWAAVNAGVLPGALTLEREGIFYDYLVIAVPAPLSMPFPADLRQARQILENKNGRGWELVSRADSPSTDAARALDLLVAHLVDNKAALEAQHVRQQEALAASKAEEASSPPAAPSTPVVRFWTIQGGRAAAAANSKKSEGGAVSK